MTTDKQILDIKLQPSVSGALDKYAAAIKAWGVTDNTPRRLEEAENAAIMAIVEAAYLVKPK